MERYICIHGHFYQPPRENPWLGVIELQDSAYPYHDWNERITTECYAPNSASRVLNAEGKITEIINNYSKISFNFGPTLLAWLESNAHETYEVVLEADKLSEKTFSGHGSALAQVYNHMILPLANNRDKYTQVIWGIRDFEYRFGRQPEGMWLAETAANLETLDILAEQGIKFTILAPNQAGKTRRIKSSSKEWHDVSGGKIDPTMPYNLRLPSGRTIIIFFYDDPISRGVAFEGLLSKGELLAQRLMDAFSDKRNWPQLVHIATDGETYGHHHRFGDMALAYALNYIESNNLAKITNYGEYLEKHPPTHEVEIIENTSWSCAHGIERWRSDCGCNSGMHPGWNQAWRAPLRESLDWLRDTIAPKYEEKAGTLLKNPWEARNGYISVCFDRSAESVEQFFSEYTARELDDTDKITALKLLELQHHAMLMYTSCGWFFDDISGIETIQVIQYAGRVIQLAQELFGDSIETQFLELLEKANSNITEYGNGRNIYEKFVRPAMVDLTKVAAHYAIDSLFEEYNEQARIYCYDVEVEDYQSFEAGVMKLVVGRAKISSEITWGSSTLSFGVLHFGDHNLNAGIREYKENEAYQLMVQDVTQAFSKAEYPEVIRQLDKHFGVSTYSLRNLFRDEQRRVLNLILESTLVEVEALYRNIHTMRYPLMRFLTDLGNPLPKAFYAVAEFIMNTDLRKALSTETLDTERVRNILDVAKDWNISLDTEGLGYLFKQTLEEIMNTYIADPENVTSLQNVANAVKLVHSLPFEVDLWRVQNSYYGMLWTDYPRLQQKAKEGDETAKEWITSFVFLGDHLSIQIPKWSV